MDTLRSPQRPTHSRSCQGTHGDNARMSRGLGPTTIALRAAIRAGAMVDRSAAANPTISVVIPTLNESAFRSSMWRLPDCVTEVIVVDCRRRTTPALSAAVMRTRAVVLE